MSDSESESDDGKDLPPAAECDRRCNEFAAITCTDTALAMFYLQSRAWSVERAVHDYFETVDSSQSSTASQQNFRNSGKVGTSSVSTFVDPEPHRVRILSWNIDGLDQNNVATRAKAVCKTILQEKPDVVFLQEVINKNLAVIRERCPGYRCILGRSSDGSIANDGEYFAMMLLRNDTVNYVAHDVQSFFTSKMSRTLLKVQAQVKDIPCMLFTTHLESMASHSSERQRQLKLCFDAMSKTPKDHTVIFGGDLNLRDKELDAVGGIPSDVTDLWQSTGSRPEARYTWDMQRNDNLEFESTVRAKCRCRFDRLFQRRSGSKLDAVYFELVGIERILECRRFPSDHWGILAHFNKKS